MQLCKFDGASSYFAVRALDFIAGYPASEGMLTGDPCELVKDREGKSRQWMGRVRCIGYAVAHALSIPISPLIALVRVVVMPIFFGMIVKECKPAERSEASKHLFFEWLKECASVVTSPVLNVAGVVRASIGVFVPSFYLKAPFVSELSESQKNQAATFLYR
jgi:hypothetical protein